MYRLINRWPMTHRKTALASPLHILTLGMLIGGLLYIAHHEAFAQSEPKSLRLAQDAPNGYRLAPITDRTVSQIKERLPAGAKVAILKVINDAPSMQMEAQMRQLLINNGYQVVGSGVATGAHDFRGFTISSKPDARGIYVLTIGDPRL